MPENIGNTPLVPLLRLGEKEGLSAALFAKLEFMNPAGSVKDRPALFMLQAANLPKGSTVIEPTSGNTGIGLAYTASKMGYKTIIVMPDSMSKERRDLIASYGAELMLTPGNLGMQGAVEKAKELQKEIPGSFLPDQFSNPNNPLAHEMTTGPELWKDTQGKLDILICGVGTGGTITGCTRYLKKQNPRLQVIAVEPAASPLLSGGKAGKHGIQGIGANFIPEILDRSLLDEVITVTDEDAFAAVRLLRDTENIGCGISGGAALSAAITVAKRPENAGKHIALILPDGSDRYTSLFS